MGKDRWQRNKGGRLMPYIGVDGSQNGLFQELDALTASATDDYTLKLNGADYFPETVNNLLVSINGVIQGGSTMSLNGAVLTVGATLSSADTIDFVRVFGNVGTVSTPTDGSVTANKIGSGAVTSAKIADGTIVNADISATAGIVGSKLGTNAVLQVKNVQTGAVNNTTSNITNDDSIPQKTEGGEFMTLAITPNSASSKLLIEVVVMGSPNSSAVVTACLFQDSTANALAVGNYYQSYATGTHNLNFKHYMTAGTTSATTFKVRAGAHTGTFTFNGVNTSSRQYGGTYASSITITEIGG